MYCGGTVAHKKTSIDGTELKRMGNANKRGNIYEAELYTIKKMLTFIAS